VPEVKRLLLGSKIIPVGRPRVCPGSRDRGEPVPQEIINLNSSPVERRKEGRRIVVHLPIRVTKVDGEGHQVTERTYIEDVSDFGCRFTTRWPVQQGETVSMELLGPDGKKLPDEDARLFEIIWVAPRSHSFTVGARVLRGEKLETAKLSREIVEPKPGLK
jgi:hypothetical protein